MMLRKAVQSTSKWGNVTRGRDLRSAMSWAVGARLDSECGQNPSKQSVSCKRTKNKLEKKNLW